MGMVVRTNTMALNAYRQLGMNNNAVSKSLEKLSSGFRINRAGDDAAGLAISEKMKAQITGLETAAANAQDGISLIQTAEGNLSEVHDMLNRMVELASKSANGTYTSTERRALQDEVDQLLDEIDRISQSANFNGTKLLDGSLDGKGKEVVDLTSLKNLSKFDSYGNRMTGVLDGEIDPTLHKNATGDSKTSFTIDLNGTTLKANEAGEITLTLHLARKDLDNGEMPTVLSQEFKINAGAAGAELSGAELTKAIYDSFKDDSYKANLVFSNDQSAADATTDDAIEYEVSMVGDKLLFKMSDTGYAAAAAAAKTGEDGNYGAAGATDATPFQGNFTVLLYASNKDGTTPAPVIKTAGKVDIGTGDVHVGSVSSGVQLAETSVKLIDEIKDGAGIKVGDESYVFAMSDKTANAEYGSNVKVVDIRDLVDEDGKLKEAEDLDGVSGEIRALAKLTQVAKDNKMFDVTYTMGDDGIFFTERYDNNSSADLTTKAGIMEQIQKFNVTINKVGGNGQALTLQIGDTADSYNKMSVNVADMSTTGLGLKGLSIMSEPDASAAIDTIKTAINSVSTARAGMGALQNRLEHTINNLDVAVENLSSANSRIRDTDMAKEMMNYTKMNVLVQSAQAMLAQANQQPQSVLQLLQ